MFQARTATMFEAGHGAGVEPSDAGGEPLLGYGACMRCQSENSPNRCYGFVGTGTICQRNWCAHNWADHA